MSESCTFHFFLKEPMVGAQAKDTTMVVMAEMRMAGAGLFPRDQARPHYLLRMQGPTYG